MIYINMHYVENLIVCTKHILHTKPYSEELIQ